MGYIADTFHNLLSGLGMPGRDKMTGFQYSTQLWTRHQLEAAFQSDWIARKAITIPAHDATREWRSWQAKADQIELLEATESRLHVQLKLQQALTKARLYGGACILIGVDGDMSMELDPETIAKDGLRYIHVLAPHQLSISNLVYDLASPYYGQPEFYELRDQSNDGNKIVRIHPSRMVRLIGLDAPDPMSNFGWGDPLMQVVHDAISGAGTVTQSIATMISEAKLDVIKIPGLTEILSTTDGTNRMIKRFSEANVAKSVVNGLLLDGEEEWQRVGTNFTGMPEILQMYMQIAAGAADIPATRFLGQSPAGLNSTGDSDMQNYYDRIASDQELRLSPALEKLDKAIIRSSLGTSDPAIFYNWNSLWQMSDNEKADIAKKKAEVTKIDVDCGLIPFVALAKGRCNQLIEDGTYPGFEAALDEELAKQDFASREEEAAAAEVAQQQQQLELAKANGGGDPAKANGKAEKVPAE
jgi:phage-related protein (TIGR01555 family)